MKSGAFERGQRAALRAVLCLCATRATLSRERAGKASGARRLELEEIALRDEQVTAALRAVLGQDADRELASMPREEREAVLDLWKHLSAAMLGAAAVQRGAV